MAGRDSFEEVFGALKAILTPYSKLVAVKDEPGHYYLETKTAARKGRPLMFAAVRSGKAYVSFHLMPLYMNPALQKSISPDLRKRMQGKSCFNFTKVDAAQIAELTKLTTAGFEEFKSWPAKFAKP